MADKDYSITTGMITKLLPWFLLLATIVGGWTTMSQRIKQLECTVAENRQELKLAKDKASSQEITLARIETDIQYIRLQIDALLKQREGVIK